MPEYRYVVHYRWEHPLRADMPRTQYTWYELLAHLRRHRREFRAGFSLKPLRVERVS